MLEKSRGLPLFGNDHFWPRFFDPLRELGASISNFFSPSADAMSKDDYYEISIELPGVDEKDIDVSIQNGSLSVRGEKHAQHEENDNNYYFSERRYGAFERIFRLPEDVREDAIKATFRNGVLNLRLPKLAPKEAVSRKIEVKSD